MSPLASSCVYLLSACLIATTALGAPPEAPPAPGTAAPADWPPWTPAPECAVERSAISPLCPTGTASCALVDDVRLSCHGADMSFAATRNGGYVLFTHPGYSRPRRLASVLTEGVVFSGPLPWDGTGGAVHVDQAGQPHVFFYGLRPAGGVGHAWPEAGGWKVEIVEHGWNAVATSVAFDRMGGVHAMLGQPSSWGPLVATTRAADGAWRPTRLADRAAGRPAIAVADGPVYGASFRVEADAPGLVLDLFQGERRFESLKIERARVDVAPVVRLAITDSSGPGQVPLAALYPQGADLVISLPAEAGRSTQRLVRIYGEASSTCQVPAQGPCPANGSTCTSVYEGGSPDFSALVVDAAGGVWAAWVESRLTRTLRLGTVYSTALPYGWQARPRRDPGSCQAGEIGREIETTLVLVAVDHGRVREALRVPLDGASLLGLRREGSDLVLGLGRETGAFRSITIKVDRLRQRLDGTADDAEGEKGE